MLAVAARRFGAAAGPASLRFFATTPGVAPTWSGQVFKDSEHAREVRDLTLVGRTRLSL